MQNTEPVPVTIPDSRLLKSDLVLNILAFLGILFILLLISSAAIYFISIAIPNGNPTLTNVLISLIITGTLGSLIGAVTFVTITMTRQANEQISLEFNAAKILAVANQTQLETTLASFQSEVKALAVANQTELQTLIQSEFQIIRRELAGLKPNSSSES